MTKEIEKIVTGYSLMPALSALLMLLVQNYIYFLKLNFLFNVRMYDVLMKSILTLCKTVSLISFMYELYPPFTGHNVLHVLTTQNNLEAELSVLSSGISIKRKGENRSIGNYPDISLPQAEFPLIRVSIPDSQFGSLLGVFPFVKLNLKY